MDLGGERERECAQKTVYITYMLRAKGEQRTRAPRHGAKVVVILASHLLVELMWTIHGDGSIVRKIKVHSCRLEAV